ncbi:MAG: hypothetical protein MJA30_09510 [Cytophagales bacterium]|nr:hypothetical protein [Cytophagales bacterium]
MKSKVFCIDESIYGNHITKRLSYIVHELKDGQLRIRNNNQKLVWLPASCFVESEIPSIVSINIDDEINNPKNDCIEVTVEFDNEEKRWATFTTVEWLKSLLKDNDYVIGKGLIFFGGSESKKY